MSPFKPVREPGGSDAKIVSITTIGIVASIMIMSHFMIGAKPIDANTLKPVEQIINIEHSENTESLSYLQCTRSNSFRRTIPIDLENSDELKDGITSFKPEKITNNKSLKNKIMNWLGDTRLIVLDIDNNGKKTRGAMNVLEWRDFQKESCSLEREIGNKNINNYKKHLQFQHYIDEK